MTVATAALCAHAIADLAPHAALAPRVAALLLDAGAIGACAIGFAAMGAELVQEVDGAPLPTQAVLLDAGAIGGCAIGFSAFGAEVVQMVDGTSTPVQAVLRNTGAIGAQAIGDGAIGGVELTTAQAAPEQPEPIPTQEVYTQGLLATQYSGPHTAHAWYGPVGGVASVRFGGAALQLRAKALGMVQPLAQFAGAVATQVFVREQGMAPQTRFPGALLVQVVHAGGAAPSTRMGGLSAGSVASLRGAGPLAQLGPLSAQLVVQAQGMPSQTRFGGATALGKSEAITQGYQGTQYGQLAVARTTVFAHSLPPTTRFSRHQLQWGQRC